MTQETTQQDTSNDTTLAAMSDEDFLSAVATSPVTEPIPTEQAAETPEAKEVKSVPAETTVEEVPATPTGVPAEEAKGTEGVPQDTNKPETQEVNYREFHEQMTKPFKANGREIQITKP